MRRLFVATTLTLLAIGGLSFAHAGTAVTCHPNCHDGVTVDGSSYGEKIVGSDEHDHLYGHAGDDRMWLGYDTDWAYGGPGNDVIHAYAPQEHSAEQTDYVNCGGGADVLITGEGDHDVLSNCETVLLHNTP